MNIDQLITAAVTVGIVLTGIMRNEFALSSLERSLNKSCQSETLLYEDRGTEAFVLLRLGGD